MFLRLQTFSPSNVEQNLHSSKKMLVENSFSVSYLNSQYNESSKLNVRDREIMKLHSRLHYRFLYFHNII